MSGYCHCGEPLCSACGRCLRAGHKPDCTSEDARAKLAALQERELKALLEKEVGKDEHD